MNELGSKLVLVSVSFILTDLPETTKGWVPRSSFTRLQEPAALHRNHFV